MRLTTLLLFLAAAPLPGVLLALADLMLGLRGDAVNMFVALCIVAASALGALVAGGLAVSLLRRTRAEGRRGFAPNR